MKIETLKTALRCWAKGLEPYERPDCEKCEYGMKWGNRWGCDLRRLAVDALEAVELLEEDREALSAVILEENCGGACDIGTEGGGDGDAV